ncbi:DUF4129 domain-containing protein [Planctomycetes bacterium K23_9]|uniref:Translation initiation factor IF-2 n=1 Tax=Stieleria marina TaxID=1930275 RepID=A0A517NZU3_9BACT|nr:Translation initiation factor IF-2 [Planctomycetes bacterium K23_9]
MISSLANFLMLILYHGQYSQRLAWTLLMYTMGAVCVARIAIEQDRNYSIGYAIALALAALVVMVRFVPGSFIFCVGILALIAYLSDRIVHDCTLIDDSVDSSGQGLIEFGKDAFQKQIAKPASQSSEDVVPSDEAKDPAKPRPKMKAHQPGRTVMYLALGALPLFGIGQFLMRSDSTTWAMAQKYLAFYLFSSLSLLVTTSFLGLRRYLRQRKVDMPSDVTVAWLAGGVVMIGLILGVAYLAPMPGQVLASIEMPDFLTSPKGFKSSSMGWGDEAADDGDSDSGQTAKDKNQQDKEIGSIKPQEGAPAGDSGDGKGEEGPPGKQSGAKKGAAGESKGESGKQKPDGQKSTPSQGSKSGEKQKAEQSRQDPSGSKSKQKSNESQPKQSKQNDAEKSGAKQSPPDQSSKPDSSSEKNDQRGDEPKSKQDQGKSEAEQRKQGEKSQPSEASANDAKTSNPDSSNPDSNDPDTGAAKANDAPSDSGSSSMGTFFSFLGGLLRLFIMAGLFAVVAVFVYLYRDAIAHWWASLWNQDAPVASIDAPTPSLEEAIQQPPRPFAAFRNPIGKEEDPRRIVVITFQAFEAWTREQGWKRDKNETPSEFLRRVAGAIPGAATPASQIVEGYNRIVYGRGKATKQDMAAAKQVWQAMQA